MILRAWRYERLMVATAQISLGEPWRMLSDILLLRIQMLWPWTAKGWLDCSALQERVWIVSLS